MDEKQKYYREITPSGFGISIKIKNVLFSTQSKYQKIEVLESDSSLGKFLTLNDLMFVSEGDAYNYSEMITHIPMISHNNPKNVLIIGGGTGSIAKEVLKHDMVEHVVVVDIDEEVVNTCKKYLPEIASQLDNEKVVVEIKNAFEYINSTEKTFDIIIITSPDPLGPGIGEYTSQVYNDLKRVLKPDGIVIMQSESPVANEEKSKTLYKSLLNNFKIVKTYASPVPTYPSSYWVWAYCSQNIKPLENDDKNRYDNLIKDCKLFTKEYAEKCFNKETLLDEIL